MGEEIISTAPTTFTKFIINTGDQKLIAFSRYRPGKPREDMIELEVKKLVSN